MSQDLNERLEQAASGITPQTKPDERRRFLGSLRERTLIRMTVAQVNDPKMDQLFLDHLNDYKGYTILINGKMAQNNFVNKLMGLCSQKDIKFTIINDETAHPEQDATGILVVSSKAINQYRIEINQVYAPSISSDQLPESHKKTNFFSRLFGKKEK